MRTTTIRPWSLLFDELHRRHRFVYVFGHFHRGGAVATTTIRNLGSLHSVRSNRIFGPPSVTTPSTLGVYGQRRVYHQHYHLSPIVEPPLDSSVTERPCTVVLMEDESLYANSWRNDFQTILPRDYGISFTSLCKNERPDTAAATTTTKSPSPSSSLSDSGHPTTTRRNFSMRLDVMKEMLPPIRDAILVCRGPLSSLCAQYYLESYPLQGLIMVDPILIDDDDDDDVNSNKDRTDLDENDDDADDENNNDTARRLIEESMLDAGVVESEEELQHFHSNKLLLEPNAVPMLVLLSIPNLSWNNVAIKNVAERHGDERGPYGRVPVVQLDYDVVSPITSQQHKQRVGQDSIVSTDHDHGDNSGGVIPTSESDSSDIVICDTREALIVIEKWIDEIL